MFRFCDNEDKLKEKILPNIEMFKVLLFQFEDSYQNYIKSLYLLSEQIIKIIPDFQMKINYMNDVFQTQTLDFLLQIFSNISNKEGIFQQNQILKYLLKIFSKISYYLIQQFDYTLQGNLLGLIQQFLEMIFKIDKGLQLYSEIIFELVYCLNSIFSFRDKPLKILQLTSVFTNIKIIDNPLGKQKLQVLEKYQQQFNIFSEFLIINIPNIYQNVSDQTSQYLLILLLEKIIFSLGKFLNEKLFSQEKFYNLLSDLINQKNINLVYLTILITKYLIVLKGEYSNQLQRYGILEIMKQYQELKYIQDKIQTQFIQKTGKEGYENMREEIFRQFILELEYIFNNMIKSNFQQQNNLHILKECVFFLNQEDFKGIQILSQFLKNYGKPTYFEIQQSNFICSLQQFFQLEKFENYKLHEEEKQNEQENYIQKSIFMKNIQEKFDYLIKNINCQLLIDSLNDLLFQNQYLVSQFKNNKISQLDSFEKISKKIKFQLNLNESLCQQDFSEINNEKAVEFYQQKLETLKQVPKLMVMVEQYGTLEIIEDYILNKFLGKNMIQTMLNQFTKNSSEIYPKNCKFSKYLEMEFYFQEVKINNEQIIFDLISENEIQQNELLLTYSIKIKKNILEKKQSYQVESQNLFQQILQKYQIFQKITDQQNKTILFVLYLLKIFYPQMNIINESISIKLFQQFNDLLFILSNNIEQEGKELIKMSTHILQKDIRILFIKYFLFPKQRAIQFYSVLNKESLKNKQQLKFVKLPRRKFKIDRQNLFLDALENFHNFGTKKEIFEYDFKDEVGTGLGPTLEFYEIFCQEIKAKDFWYKTDDYTLFPKPFSNKMTSQDIFDFFQVLGNLTARAIFDERVIDLPINKNFFRLLKGEKLKLDDFSLIDRKLTIQLKNLKEHYKKDSDYFGKDIKDLCINFVFPGYEDIELINRGSHVFLSNDNVKLYIRRIKQIIFQESIRPCLEGFIKGFQKLIDIQVLNYLDASDIESLYFGDLTSFNWDFQYLYENIVPSYGYQKDSEVFNYLLRFLVEISQDEKKLFLKFVTGSSKLPINGLAGLDPKLTVVKKDSKQEEINMVLPSVMTFMKQQVVKITQSCLVILHMKYFQIE